MKKLIPIFMLLICLLAGCTPAGKPETLSAEGRAGVEEYLSMYVGVSGFGGKVFCPFDVLGQDSDGTHLYVWAVCMEYRVVDGALVQGTGSSLPVSLTIKRDGDAVQVLAHRLPNEGWSEENIRELFPREMIQAFCMQEPECFNERAGRLEKEAETEAAKDFGVKP